MTQVNIPHESWVVVCDGAKALFLRNAGDHQRVKLKELDVFVDHEPATRDLGTERPGRVHQSHGSARSSVETTDLHADAEVAFLARVAGHLDKSVRELALKSIVLVAPPKALGILRKQLSAAVQAVVTAEVAKDLAHQATSDIEAHLAA